MTRPWGGPLRKHVVPETLTVLGSFGGGKGSEQVRDERLVRLVCGYLCYS